MNCKPGEMAVIVRNTCSSVCMESVKGFVIQVDRSEVARNDGLLEWDVWFYKGPRLRCQHGNVFNFFLDADLQPIRGLPACESEGESGSRPVVVEGVTEKAGTP